MNENLFRPQFDTLKLSDKLWLMQTLATRYHLTFKELYAFSRWRQSCTTGLFEKGGREFVFVPGDTVTLGWDAEAGKVVAKNLDGWQFGEVVEYTAPEGSKNIWWGYKWYNLPAYDAEGNIYRYYAKEQTPVGSGWQLVTDDPNAGGIGTLPFTLGGLLLMAAAALLLGQEIKRRREGC